MKEKGTKKRQGSCEGVSMKEIEEMGQKGGRGQIKERQGHGNGPFMLKDRKEEIRSGLRVEPLQRCC